MGNFAKLLLKPGRNKSVRAFHPWVFSGAVGKADKNISDGDVVEIFSDKNEYLATGHYNNGSITARIFSFVKTEAGKKK
jgi:23S rRNA (cytosine1962-C5)-methyltransferase